MEVEVGFKSTLSDLETVGADGRGNDSVMPSTVCVSACVSQLLVLSLV